MRKFAKFALCISILLLIGCGTDDAPPANVTKPEMKIDPGRSSATVDSSSETTSGSDGEAIFGEYCRGCHDAGEGHPGTMRLAVRLGSENSVLRQRSDLPPEYVKIIIRNGFEMMPAFRPTEIPDAELDALAAYVSVGYKSP